MANLVILMGRLTADPKKMKLSDHDFVSFTLAVKRKYKNADGEYATDFINCVAWEKKAELLGKLTKGEQIAITGSLQTRNYDDKDGNKKFVVEVVVDAVDFMGAKKSEPKEEQSTLTEIFDDDSSSLPF